jgi:hypothetical protein
MRANSIKEVLEILDGLIDRFMKEQNPIGYFPAIYKQTTMKVAENVSKKAFQDNERMERFDVIFANMYFESLQRYLDGEKAVGPWQVSFEAAEDKGLIVDQHFFCAANAHINYDLGIAVSKMLPGEKVYEFEPDFILMNQVLASLYDRVNVEVARFWPHFAQLMKLFGKEIRFLENVAMIRERKNAWNHALMMSLAGDSERESVRSRIEKEVTDYGRKVIDPGCVIKAIMRHNAREEKGTVADRIDILADLK